MESWDFPDTRIVLILSDNHSETVAYELKLFPQYFTAIEDDPKMETVLEILRKRVRTCILTRRIFEAGDSKPDNPEVLY